jgi:acetyltransferase-like isoleucine patch superfamily enzyme
VNRLDVAVREVLRDPTTLPRKFRTAWAHLWVPRADLSPLGRIAARLATWCAPPYTARGYLAHVHPRGFVSPGAVIYHKGLRLGRHVFIGDGATIFQSEHAGPGGPVVIGDDVNVWGHCLIETGASGSITIGAGTRVHRGCQLVSYLAPIRIGRDVGLAQNCALYSYNHGFEPGAPVSEQPLQTRGPIVIEDHAWLGIGVIVLDGLRIGRGAVIGAGAVVTHDIPDGAIAFGVPARVVRFRNETRGPASVLAGDEHDTANAPSYAGR